MQTSSTRVQHAEADLFYVNPVNCFMFDSNDKTWVRMWLPTSI